MDSHSGVMALGLRPKRSSSGSAQRPETGFMYVYTPYCYYYWCTVTTYNVVSLDWYFWKCAM